MYTLGLDFGSTASKGVLLKDGKEIVDTKIVPFGTGTSAPEKVKNALVNTANGDVSNIVVTGYGRNKYKNEKDTQISELSCHVKGVYFLHPAVRTILDIGGQDVKAIKVNKDGRMINFLMNDKCAAGTGRFLDVMSKVLETDISKLGDLDKLSKNPVSISSTCTVFAESEVISQLSTDAKIEDIVAGIHNSVAYRAGTLIKGVGIEDDVVMVGGVAQNTGVVRALEDIIKTKIYVPEMAQLTGALGAAIYAYEKVKD